MNLLEPSAHEQINLITTSPLNNSQMLTINENEDAVPSEASLNQGRVYLLGQ